MTKDELHSGARTALFQGSFDPFTAGHESIVRRALALFDRVVIAVVHNVNKSGLLPVADRERLIASVFADCDRVRVVSSPALTVDAAREFGARCLLRGVRTVADFEYEMTMAQANRDLSGGTLDTVLLYTEPRLAHVSSSLVRELLRFDRDVTPYMPSRGCWQEILKNVNIIKPIQ